MPHYLQRDDGDRIAYVHTPGASPGVIFCPGLMSNMDGTKALELEAWCQQRGQQYTGRIFTLDHDIINGVGKVEVDDSTWIIVRISRSRSATNDSAVETIDFCCSVKPLS